DLWATPHSRHAPCGLRVSLVEPGYSAPGMNPSDDHTGPPAYAELWEQWKGTDAKLNADGRPGPEIVGTAIADAIENPDTPLRVPVGDDAHMILSARKHFDDAGFEDAMRKTLDFPW